MHRAPYLVSLFCLVLVLVVLPLGDPSSSPAVLCGALIGTAVLCVALGRPLQLLGEIRYRLPAED